MDLLLLEFNGIEVIVHLQQLIDESTGPFMTFQFAPRDVGKFVVLDRDNHDATAIAVCEERSIGTPFASHRIIDKALLIKANDR